MADKTNERSFGRAADEMRPVTLTRGVMMNAEGSCLAQFGNTKVLCSATIAEGVPAWRKNAGAGWVTAEYAMLPHPPTTARPASTRAARAVPWRSSV